MNQGVGVPSAQCPPVPEAKPVHSPSLIPVPLGLDSGGQTVVEDLDLGTDLFVDAYDRDRTHSCPSLWPDCCTCLVYRLKRLSTEVSKAQELCLGGRNLTFLQAFTPQCSYLISGQSSRHRQLVRR